MRQLFLAVLGVFAVAGVASAQQPQYQQPIKYPAGSPGAAAATPVQPASGATVIRGNGCTNCGPAAAAGPSAHKSFTMSGVAGGNCNYGNGCQNGCGSLKSDLSFHFGSCKQFFAPCGPGLGGHKCGALPFAAPWGTGWQCPPGYDSYANH